MDATDSRPRTSKRKPRVEQIVTFNTLPLSAYVRTYSYATHTLGNADRG